MRTRIGLVAAVIAVVAGAQVASAGGFVNLPRSGIGFRTSQPAYRQWGTPRMIKDRKSTRLNSSHIQKSRMPSSA